MNRITGEQGLSVCRYVVKPSVNCSRFWIFDGNMLNISIDLHFQTRLFHIHPRLYKIFSNIIHNGHASSLAYLLRNILDQSFGQYIEKRRNLACQSMLEKASIF